MDANWLQAKTAGLPRWAWITALGGAVVLGLYLRSRNAEGENELEEEEEIEPSSELEGYDGTEQGTGLAAAGLIGPAAGQVVPVEAPFLPEGFTELLGQQGAANVEAQQAIAGLAQAALEREPSERVEVINERAPSESNAGTGGGAPKRKPSHKAPAKQKKPPKQKRPPRNKPQKKARGGGKHRAAVGPGHRAR